VNDIDALGALIVTVSVGCVSVPEVAMLVKTAFWSSILYNAYG
jgi:hypothetical protein